MEPSRTKPESESQRVEVERSIDWEIVCLKGERGEESWWSEDGLGIVRFL